MTSSLENVPVLITRASALQQMVEKLGQETLIAVDTESNSLFAYREKVCLIQFSTAQADYLVDPLALKDLTALAQVFADPQIEKVFHAAEYDLICLKRDFDFQFVNLFDTMLAARVLGREAVGLGSLLESEFGVQLDKRYQRANWGQRPLPPDLLQYARLDTHYLIPLRHRLRTVLTECNLLALAEEDFLRQAHAPLNGNGDENRGNDWWRVSGAYELSPQQAAVLNELHQYREQVARTLDRPRFKVLNDSTLVAIAVAEPRRLADLKDLPGMNERQVQRHGQRLLEAVARGQRAEPLRPPRSPRPDEQYLERLEALRHWRKAAALKMGVSSDVVLPRDLLYNLAGRNPAGHAELAAVLAEVPWRMERFGIQILQVLAGQAPEIVATGSSNGF